jgi:hypothetical protein
MWRGYTNSSVPGAYLLVNTGWLLVEVWQLYQAAICIYGVGFALIELGDG